MSNRMLSIVMAIMASMSTTMLGLGQGSALLPVMTILAATTSVLFTDTLGWFRLNRVVANLAMLLAAFFSLYGFLESGSQQQLWAIANLLIYVQMVLLFQEKNRRVYGQLAMFSLLQVVVAALLNSGLEFGVLLGVYMVVALLGFVLFFVYREVGRVGMVTRRRGWFERVEAVPGRLDAQLDGPPVIQVVEQGASLNQSIVTRRIVSPIVAMVAATVMFTAVFFYTSPRTGGANWQRGLGPRKLVGFSPEVTFEEMGKLLLNDERVMRVSFTNAISNEAYTVIGDPYLRGIVLTKYINGRWQQEVRSSRLPLVSLESPPITRELVRQEILLEPTGSSRLFSMFPVYGLAQSPADLRIDPRTRHLMRSTPNNRKGLSEFRYVVATTAFRFGAQNQVIPHPNRLQNDADRASMVLLNRWMRNINSPETLPQLIAVADAVVKADAPNGNNFQRARALESHFLDGRRYTYTLNLDEVQAERKPNVDPIEDFVNNHHKGHCEYFASALTLMLRSQGIPARMVIGYRPSEFNYIGNYFVVRQRDAHAWVEAYMRPEEIPDEAINPEERHAGGGWMRLDPTPREQFKAAVETNVFDRASKSFDYARWLWNDYVLRLTEERQKRAVLAPLSLDRQFSITNVVDVGAWQQLVAKVTGTDWQRLLRGEFSWRGGLAAIFACGLAYFGYRLVRNSLPLLQRWWPYRRGVSRRRKRRVSVAFYRQFEAALARVGLQRSVAQTQRQFAGMVAQQLAATPEHAVAADIPQQIVEAFYRVRFGHWRPDAQQEAEILEQLKRLEETLAN